jgi:hypothetical protein
MIGLSLSYCVRDILHGVDIDDVTGIVTSTRAPTPNDWEDVIEYYTEKYWKDSRAIPIVYGLQRENKIIQPRTFYPSAVLSMDVRHGRAGGWWINDKAVFDLTVSFSDYKYSNLTVTWDLLRVVIDSKGWPAIAAQ